MSVCEWLKPVITNRIYNGLQFFYHSRIQGVRILFAESKCTFWHWVLSGMSVMVKYIILVYNHMIGMKEHPIQFLLFTHHFKRDRYIYWLFSSHKQWVNNSSMWKKIKIRVLAVPTPLVLTEYRWVYQPILVSSFPLWLPPKLYKKSQLSASGWRICISVSLPHLALWMDPDNEWTHKVLWGNFFSFFISLFILTSFFAFTVVVGLGFGLWGWDLSWWWVDFWFFRGLVLFI